MFDILKMNSKELNIQIKICVYLPNDYNTNNQQYESVYIVSGKNPFEDNTLNLEKRLNYLNKVGIAIYPAIDIKKNTLLFNTLNDKLGYAALYEDFIVNTIIPHIQGKYRLSPDRDYNSILGFNETSILAFNISARYPYLFSKLNMHDLCVSGYEKKFRTHLITTFNPFLAIYYSACDETHQIIKTNLDLLGAIEFKRFNSFKDILERL